MYMYVYMYIYSVLCDSIACVNKAVCATWYIVLKCFVQ